MNTLGNLPTREQMANLISQITPDDHYEQRVSFSGMLCLRVKSPCNEYQGVHFGLSRMARTMIEGKLEDLQPRHDRDSFVLTSSYPAGRAWFHLNCSSLDVNPLTKITFSLVTDLDVLGEVEWDNHHMMLRFSASGLKTFLEGLREKSNSSKLAIRRFVKPESEPQSCWIWEW